MIPLVLLSLLALFIIVMMAKTVRIVPQARVAVVERFGKFKQTLPAGLNVVVPFIDKVKPLILKDNAMRLLKLGAHAPAAA